MSVQAGPPPLHPHTVSLLPKVLMTILVSSVTLWYLATPYLVRPHTQFAQDMAELISNTSQPQTEYFVENWTKWRLYLGEGEDRVVVYPHQQVSIHKMEFPVVAMFEWRQEYSSRLDKEEEKLLVEHIHPWYSKFGIYNHFHTQTEGRTVRFIPTFMFGAPQSVVDGLYGGAGGIPVVGMMAEGTGMDRVMVQSFMNLVIISVVFMLWVHNK